MKAYRILIKAAVFEGTERTFQESADAVAEQLDEIQACTPTFLGFTLTNDRVRQTVQHVRR